MPAVNKEMNKVITKLNVATLPIVPSNRLMPEKIKANAKDMAIHAFAMSISSVREVLMLPSLIVWYIF